MRKANLLFLLLFAAASCDMRPSSSSAAAQTASLPASLPPQAPPASGAKICGYSFEPASADEAASFLQELSGGWRDDLSAPILVGNDAVTDGLLIDENTIIPTQLPAVGGTAPLAALQPNALAIGPVSSDGFRIVQLSVPGEPGCLAYALKKEGTATLLVRGPLSPVSSKALSAAAFHAATYDSTRIFSSF